MPEFFTTEKFQNFLAYEWAGNSMYEIVIAVLICIGLLIIIKLFLDIIFRMLERVAERTHFRIPLLVVHFLETVPLWMWIILAVTGTAHLLTIPSSIQTALAVVALAIIVALSVQLLQQVLEYLLYRHAPRLRAGEGETLPGLIRFSLAITLWVLGILLVISNIGVNVTSLIAGLGVGGIAIALAAQNILGDVFSSFSIFFDQPFKEGDFIVVGPHMGTVKQIGLKSTRLQALQGEEIVISNRELTSVRVQNFKKMRKRRVEFHFTLKSGTPLETIKRVPETVMSVLGAIEDVTPARVHVREILEEGSVIEVVYRIDGDNYDAFMNTQQRIIFALLEKFEKEGMMSLKLIP
jgi:small-conductance mechanosensitive channel